MLVITFESLHAWMSSCLNVFISENLHVWMSSCLNVFLMTRDAESFRDLVFVSEESGPGLLFESVHDMVRGRAVHNWSIWAGWSSRLESWSSHTSRVRIHLAEVLVESSPSTPESYGMIHTVWIIAICKVQWNCTWTFHEFHQVVKFRPGPGLVKFDHFNLKTMIQRLIDGLNSH